MKHYNILVSFFFKCNFFITHFIFIVSQHSENDFFIQGIVFSTVFSEFFINENVRHHYCYCLISYRRKKMKLALRNKYINRNILFVWEKYQWIEYARSSLMLWRQYFVIHFSLIYIWIILWICDHLLTFSIT